MKTILCQILCFYDREEALCLEKATHPFIFTNASGGFLHCSPPMNIPVKFSSKQMLMMDGSRDGVH